jgi:hypothetical protein
MSAKLLSATPTCTQYVIQGGEAEVQRLRLLARAKWPTTEALLR